VDWWAGGRGAEETRGSGKVKISGLVDKWTGGRGETNNSGLVGEWASGQGRGKGQGARGRGKNIFAVWGKCD
jgi:hypothetical protein